MLLGAGREKVEDIIDHHVGIIMHKKPGDKVATGDTLVELHYNHVRHVMDANDLVLQAYTIGSTAQTLRSLILETV